MESINNQRCLHAVIEGHVQGVGFRYFVKETADALLLTGWVRNRYDSNVELMAEGLLDNLQTFLDKIRVGPSRSIVTNINIDWDEPTHQYSQFSFLQTD
ncbi:MAG: acylphosphatase [Anaerolineaceae bacterium]